MATSKFFNDVMDSIVVREDAHRNNDTLNVYGAWLNLVELGRGIADFEAEAFAVSVENGAAVLTTERWPNWACEVRRSFSNAAGHMAWRVDSRRWNTAEQRWAVSRLGELIRVPHKQYKVVTRFAVKSHTRNGEQKPVYLAEQAITKHAAIVALSLGLPIVVYGVEQKVAFHTALNAYRAEKKSLTADYS